MAEQESTQGQRFAAYDKRLLRFVGGVHDSEQAAKDAAKAAGVKAADTDVRKV